MKNYFASVSSANALNMIGHVFEELAFTPKERSDVYKITEIISKYLLQNEGLELGNQISQIAAIFYCNSVDHYVLEFLKLPLYGRYMDDSYVVCPSRNEAKRVLEEIKFEYSKLGLLLNEKKTTIRPLFSQHVFLKTLFKIDESKKITISIPSSTIRRATRHYKKLVSQFELGVIDNSVLVQSLASFNSVAKRTTNPNSTFANFISGMI